jgi:hypothetical protein
MVKLDEITDLWYNKAEVMNMRLEEARAFHRGEGKWPYTIRIAGHLTRSFCNGG